MLDFACANAECQSPERAVRRGVAIAAHNRLPRLRNAQLGTNHVHNALIVAEHVEKSDPRLATIALKRRKLTHCGLIENRQIAILCGDGMIHDGERLVWPPFFSDRLLMPGIGL